MTADRQGAHWRCKAFGHSIVFPAFDSAHCRRCKTHWMDIDFLADHFAMVRLLVLLAVVALSAALAMQGCGMLPEPVEPAPDPEPVTPSDAPACERACIRYLHLDCRPVMDLADCSKACEQAEALALDVGQDVGWHPSVQAETSTCVDWENARGNGT